MKPKFNELFEKNWKLNEKFYSTSNHDKLKEEVKEFMDECIRKSHYVSDIHQREHIRDFIRSWCSLMFPNRRFGPINLKPPKGDKYTSSRDKPSSFITYNKMGKLYKTRMFGGKTDKEADRTLVDVLTSEEIPAVIYVPPEYPTDRNIGAFNYGKEGVVGVYAGLTQITTKEDKLIVVNIDNPGHFLLRGRGLKGKIVHGKDFSLVNKLSKLLPKPEVEHYYFEGTAEEMLKELQKSGYRTIER